MLKELFVLPEGTAFIQLYLVGNSTTIMLEPRAAAGRSGLEALSSEPKGHHHDES